MASSCGKVTNDSGDLVVSKGGRGHTCEQRGCTGGKAGASHTRGDRFIRRGKGKLGVQWILVALFSHSRDSEFEARG